MGCKMANPANKTVHWFTITIRELTFCSSKKITNKARPHTMAAIFSTILRLPVVSSFWCGVSVRFFTKSGTPMKPENSTEKMVRTRFTRAQVLGAPVVPYRGTALLPNVTVGTPPDVSVTSVSSFCASQFWLLLALVPPPPALPPVELPAVLPGPGPGLPVGAEGAWLLLGTVPVPLGAELLPEELEEDALLELDVDKFCSQPAYSVIELVTVSFSKFHKVPKVASVYHPKKVYPRSVGEGGGVMVLPCGTPCSGST